MNITINFKSGGGAVLDRVIEAYGFSTKIQLCQLLNIASSSLANRYKNDFFPADIVVRCMAETGVSLEWLVTGHGEKYSGVQTDIISLDRSTIKDGKLIPSAKLPFNVTILPAELDKPEVIENNRAIYIVDKVFSDSFEGEYLVDIEGKIDIHYLERIPVKKVRVSGGGISQPFECGIDDIKPMAKVKAVYKTVD